MVRCHYQRRGRTMVCLIWWPKWLRRRWIGWAMTSVNVKSSTCLRFRFLLPCFEISFVLINFLFFICINALLSNQLRYGYYVITTINRLKLWLIGRLFTEPFVDMAAVFSNLTTVCSLSRDLLKKVTNTCHAL